VLVVVSLIGARNYEGTAAITAQVALCEFSVGHFPRLLAFANYGTTIVDCSNPHYCSS